jgi:single-stranded-DNA-specific exonuclease
LRYKLVKGSTNNYTSENIKEDILKFRGIENPSKYLNLKSDVEIPFSKLNNIERAVECLLKHLDNNDIIYLQVDNDVDGMSSASSLYLGIKEIYPNARICWDIQDGKAHGVDLKQIPKGTKLVVIPDAGSNQYEEHRKLNKKVLIALF